MDITKVDEGDQEVEEKLNDEEEEDYDELVLYI